MPQCCLRLRKAWQEGGLITVAWSNTGRQEDRVVYCGDFQNDACNLQDNHGGQFFGQSVSFQHICATCWKCTKTLVYHPASSMDCPFYEHWLTRLAPGREGNPGAIPDDGRCLSNGVMTECESLLEIHEKVKETGSPIFESAKIPIKSRWNIAYMRRHLSAYHDQMVVTLCKYGWPIGITDSENLERHSVKNHSGAHEFPDQMDDYIARESGEGTLLGPFKTTHFGRKW